MQTENEGKGWKRPEIALPLQYYRWRYILLCNSNKQTMEQLAKTIRRKTIILQDLLI